VSDVLLSATIGIVGALLTVWGGSLFVGYLVEPYADQLEHDTGLEQGGHIIGITERLLIYVFVLAEAPTAIGLLVTAKSILRFREVSDVDRPKQSEYVIIGTLLSFAFAVTTSYIVRWFLDIVI